MSKKILIATIMRAQGETGVQTHFRTYMACLRESGKPCELITPFNAPLWLVYPVFGLRKLVDLFNREIGVWWYRYWHTYFLYQALKKKLRNGEACVIYAQCPLSAQAALGARRSKIYQQVVMVTHFNISQADEWVGKGLIANGGWLYRSIRKLEAEVLPKLDGLVFVSDFMRRELVGRIPAVKEIAYRIVPNFLPDPGITADQAEPDTDLICIGTLEPRKNQRFALEIVAASVRLGRPLSLTVVGDGPDRKMLESLSLELKIQQHVYFAGFLSNAAALMPKHRSCLHVSLMESFGIVLIEALARGLPVFAPAVGGIPEVFEEGVEGRLIPLSDADAAAKIIIDWLDSPQIYRQAQRSARSRFLARFEAEQVAAILTDFLEQKNSRERVSMVMIEDGVSV